MTYIIVGVVVVLLLVGVFALVRYSLRASREPGDIHARLEEYAKRSDAPVGKVDVVAIVNGGGVGGHHRFRYLCPAGP